MVGIGVSVYDWGMKSKPNGGNVRAVTQPNSGQFQVGWGGGPGRRGRERLADLHALLAANVPEEDWKAIIKMLVERAKGGDIFAARELLDRRYGRAIPAEAPVVAVQVNVGGKLTAESNSLLDDLEVETKRLKLEEIAARETETGGP